MPPGPQGNVETVNTLLATWGCSHSMKACSPSLPNSHCVQEERTAPLPQALCHSRVWSCLYQASCDLGGGGIGSHDIGKGSKGALTPTPTHTPPPPTLGHPRGQAEVQAAG